MNDDFVRPEPDEGPHSAYSDEAAKEVVRRFFEEHRERVVFSRQVQVLHEDDWYHWITNRALHHLIGTGEVTSEWRDLATGAPIKLMWHRSHRYYRRDAARLIALVEEYADPAIGAASVTTAKCS